MTQEGGRHAQRDRSWEPLKGIVVLDASQGIAGPYCGAILCAQGATVYKVEPPAGDWGRNIGTAAEGMSALSTGMNGGKRAACIDASTPEGAKLMTRLAEKADVVIEGFRPGVAARVGLDPERLLRLRPDQIILSISGFGPSGPGARRPGSDTVLQAMSGMMHLNAESDGTPRLVPMYLIDTATALYASQLLTAALLERGQTGAGRHLEVSLLEAAAAFQAVPQLEAALQGHFPTGHPPVPSGVFKTKDGHIRVTSLTQRNFESLSKGLNKEAWITDPAFATPGARSANADRLNAELADIIATRSNTDWIQTLQPLGVLCAPVNDYQEFREDPQVQAMNIFSSIAQPGLGTIPLPGHPGLTGAPQPAPRLGEHTREVLAALDIPDDEVETLIAAGIVQAMGTGDQHDQGTAGNTQ